MVKRVEDLVINPYNYSCLVVLEEDIKKSILGKIASLKKCTGETGF